MARLAGPVTLLAISIVLLLPSENPIDALTEVGLELQQNLCGEKDISFRCAIRKEDLCAPFLEDPHGYPGFRTSKRTIASNSPPTSSGRSKPPRARSDTGRSRVALS